jgi:predicted MPP superfamily phosphohydrolase
MPVSYGLIDAVDLPLPGLAPRLEGLRIVHLTDLHITAPRRRHAKMVDQLSRMRTDLVLMTGDYMSWPGDEPAAVKAMTRIIQQLKPKLGIFGIFGNHDTEPLRRELTDLPVTWLHHRAHRLAEPAVQLLGMGELAGESRDSLAGLLDEGAGDGLSGQTAGSAEDRPLRLMLAHRPEALLTAGDMAVDLMLAGHTHGGQCRLPGKRALMNSCSFPLALSAGAFRHRQTLGVISRGAGEILLPLRVLCPPHVPLYTLRRRPMPGPVTDGIHPIWRW